MRTCFTQTIAGWPIALRQEGPDNFQVRYGQQIKRGLSYGEAARELGSCIMHALACAGDLDNSEDGEEG